MKNKNTIKMLNTITMNEINAAIQDAEVEIDVEGTSVYLYRDVDGDADITLHEEDFEQCSLEEIEWLMRVLNERLKELTASE